jgi:hypothetical protein
LVDAAAALFISSLSDDTLIQFVRFLLAIPGTPRLINSILISTQHNFSISYQQLEMKSASLFRSIHAMLVPLVKYVGNLLYFIRKILESPSLLSSLLDVLELIPSSNEHSQAVDTLCLKAVELLHAFPLSEPLLHDICTLFKHVIVRTEAEVTELRISVKTSRIRRLLTTVGLLCSINCWLHSGLSRFVFNNCAEIFANFSAQNHLGFVIISRPFLELFVSAFERIWRLFP